MLLRENLNFLDVRNAGFWHSGRLFTLLQMPSLQNFKNFFGDRPFKPPTMFFMFFLMAQIFRKAFRIVGLDGGKCRRVVEQDFHRNFRTWICGFFSLPFFSHLFSFLHFFKQTYRLIVFLHALYFLLNHHVELIHKNFTFT